MNTTPPLNDGRPTPGVEVAGEQMQEAQDVFPAEADVYPADGIASTPALSATESRVLAVLSEERHLSFNVLRTRVGSSAGELRAALDALRAQGLVTRLNTLGESYAARFPGLSVDD
ncbi:MAG: MarR family transcriptional regulator [Thermoleophilia bacterium]